MRVEAPRDPRFAPFERLRIIMALPPHDKEEKSEKHLLHRADLKMRVQS
jgi:hypothetical protein